MSFATVFTKSFSYVNTVAEVGSQSQDTFTELDYIEGFEILDIVSDTIPAMIQLAVGKLTLDFDSLDISLDSGQAVTYEEVRRVAQDYWDEFAARTKQV